MPMKYIVFLLGLAVLLAGCVDQNSTPDDFTLEYIHIPGHGDQVYQFSNDVINTLERVPVNNPGAIKSLADSSERYIIVFDDLASPEEKARYSVVSYNVIIKLKTYYAYEKGIALGERNFPSYYHSDGKWYYNEQEIIDANDENIIDHKR